MGAINNNPLTQFFKGKSILSILILINVGVYLAILLTGIIAVLFKSQTNFLFDNLVLPADLTSLFYKPWTIITYMFTHLSFWHILFNMLWLYWFGKIFESFFGSRPLGGLYFLGGIAGAVVYIASYNLFPAFQDEVSHSVLLGASASVMAIVFSSALYRPDYSIRLFLFGQIKIIYIALFLLIINIITLPVDNPEGGQLLNNAGGFFAHLGGILMGVWYASAYKRGKDLTKGINRFLDKFSNLFKKKPKKAKMKVKYNRAETDMEYNARKNQEQEEVDRILDKIKRSGYNALTDSEKDKLFKASKKQ
jgi:Uncharacterized membrane protein (homolog of Drosophila rhomboid)